MSIQHITAVFQGKNLWKARAKRVIEWLPNKGKLLDVGSCYGWQTEMFLEKADFVVGIEKLRNYQDEWRKLKSHVLKGDAVFLPIKDKSFDIVVATEILEHLHDEGKCLREIKRVLMPDGTLIVSVPNRNRIHRRLLKFFRIKKPIFEEHLREYTLPEIKKILREENFVIEKISGSGFIWFELLARLFPGLAISFIIKARAQSIN